VPIFKIQNVFNNYEISEEEGPTKGQGGNLEIRESDGYVWCPFLKFKNKYLFNNYCISEEEGPAKKGCSGNRGRGGRARGRGGGKTVGGWGAKCTILFFI
jgi:hypothetical protein